MKGHFLTQLNILLQVTGITSGRAAALIPAGLGLISVIIGWISLKRSKHQLGKGRSFAITALLFGVTDLVLSVLHLIRTSDSSIGTGSGKLGAIVAIVFGLIGITLGGITMSRSGTNDTTARK